MSQSKMTTPGLRCRNELPCKHFCPRAANSLHICACWRIWKFDPGCGHIVRTYFLLFTWQVSRIPIRASHFILIRSFQITGDCSKSFALCASQPCLARCGKRLNCGHKCKRVCGSTCACAECSEMPTLKLKLDLKAKLNQVRTNDDDHRRNAINMNSGAYTT